MKKIIAIVAVTMGAAVLSGCSSPASTKNQSSIQPSSTKNLNDSTNASAQDQKSAESNAITIQNFAFNPGTITVKKGTTVTWTNNDSMPHQIKSATFNSSVLNKGQSFSFTFNQVGTFDYVCGIHPSMAGKIIVE